MELPSLKMLNRGPNPFVQLDLASQWLLLRSLTLTVSYESLKFTKVSTWDSPYPRVLCHHIVSWKALFIIWLGNFIAYPIPSCLRLSSVIFGYNQKLNPPSNNKVNWKEWCHMLQTIPQVNIQRAFEEDHSHLCIRVLGHLQNNISIAQMEK